MTQLLTNKPSYTSLRVSAYSHHYWKAFVELVEEKTPALSGPPQVIFMVRDPLSMAASKVQMLFCFYGNALKEYIETLDETVAEGFGPDWDRCPVEGVFTIGDVNSLNIQRYKKELEKELSRTGEDYDEWGVNRKRTKIKNLEVRLDVRRWDDGTTM